MKFEIGQKVKIIFKDSPHYKDVGIVAEINYIVGGYPYFVKINNECRWFLELELQQINKTIRDVEIGDVIIDYWNISKEIIDVGKNGFVTHIETYWTFEEAEEKGLKIVEEEPKDLLSECLKYCKHRLKSHPEAGLRKFISVKKLDKILKKIEKIKEEIK